MLANIFLFWFLAFYIYSRQYQNPALNAVFKILKASPDLRIGSQLELRPPRTALFKQPSFDKWLYAACVKERIPWEGFPELEEPSQGVI